MAKFYTYGSMGEFLAAANGPSDMPVSSRQSRDTFQSAWAGSPSFEAANALAMNGCPETEARIQKRIVDLDLAGKCPRHEVYFDVTGQDVDICRYLDGEPECMMDYELPQRDGGKFITLVASFSISANVDADVIERRGAAVCCVLDALENAGYRCEVIAVCCIQSWGTCEPNEVRVTVKNAQEPLDMTRLAYCLAHPSMLRRTCFSLEETWSATERRAFKVGTGYGVPAGSQGDRGDVYLGSLDWHHFDNDRNTQQWIDDTLKKLTGGNE